MKLILDISVSNCVGRFHIAMLDKSSDSDDK